MDFGDIRRVGLNHLQLLFRKLPVVDVRSFEKMLAGFQVVPNLSAIGRKVGHNPAAFLTVEWSDLSRRPQVMKMVSLSRLPALDAACLDFGTLVLMPNGTVAEKE